MSNYSTNCSFCGNGTGQVCKCGETSGLPLLTKTQQPTDQEMILIIRSLYSNLTTIHDDLVNERIDLATFSVGCNIGVLHNFLKKYNYPVF